MKDIVLYAPSFYDSPFRRNIVDGEVLYLAVHLRRLGYHVTVVDRFHKAAGVAGDIGGVARANALMVVHLWTADAYGEPLALVARDLATLRQAHPSLRVIAFGPLATSAEQDLLDSGAVDGIARRWTTSWREGSSAAPGLAALADALQAYYSTFPSLTELQSRDLGLLRDSVVSVAGSRACKGRCTFCSYNADVGGEWLPRSMKESADDIAFLFRTAGVTRFAFSDNDFGGTVSDCEARAELLATSLAQHGLEDEISISVSVRPSTLSEKALTHLARAGVRTALVGVESFSAKSLRLYGKPMDTAQLREICDAAERVGITIVASYILWHPFQTLDSLAYELAELRRFGRHRVPQFLARSVLQVIPGTPMERRLGNENLLVAGRFRRDFVYVDGETERAHARLKQWFDVNVRTVLKCTEHAGSGAQALLAEKKIAEFSFLVDLVSRSTATG